ncbi:MAG TPA: gluconolaconase, partial [Telluria sp.]|nr:gluconolaconase [Telluria sp.]
MHKAIHGFTKHAWHVLLAASLVCIGLAGCGGPADSSSVTHVSAAKMSGQAADQVIPNSCTQTGQGCGGGSVRYPDPGLYLVAGHTGGSGSVDGKRAAARFRDPTGLAMDRAGNLYVADTFNSTIRKITPSGTVSTLAGKAGVEDSADGTGGAAHFNRPYGIAADARGNLYVADTYNHTVRRITAAGVVTTIAGAAGVPGSADGTGTAARFAYPGAIAVDRA